MEEFEKNIDRMRTFFDEQKAARYPVCNTLLKEKDEYTRSLYIRMLCMLIQYGSNADEMQVLYLKRIIAGTACEENAQDYMRKALEVEIEDINSFIDTYKEDMLRFHFAIEGMILLAMSKEAEKSYELLAELIEMLGITKSEVAYLSAVASAAIECSSEKVDAAREMKTESLENMDISLYIKSFYSGLLIDSDEVKYYYSKEKAELDTKDMECTFSHREIIFENLVLNIDKYWEFMGCEKAKFINCSFIGSEKRMIFSNIGQLEFIDCKFKDFTNRMAAIYTSNKIIIRGCIFSNCGAIVDGAYFTNSNIESVGGVFFIQGKNGSEELETIIVEDSQILNCYIKERKDEYGYRVSGAFMGGHGIRNVKSIIIRNNKFIGNRIENNGNYTEGLIYQINGAEVLEENNECTGGVQTIFA